jgi:hypothetical protein
MKLKNIKILLVFFAGIITIGSCTKTLDINTNPDLIPDSNSPIAQLLTGSQVNLGFEGGSDLFRYATQIMQQMSGAASQPNQTYEYGRYNIQGSDENNVWSSIFARTLNNLELIIKQASSSGSPNYSGVAKILKAYEYSLVVDTWGSVPYTEAQQLASNTQPHYDSDSSIYTKLFTLLNDGINEVSATTSVLSPGTNSIFYTNGNFSAVRSNWIKLANTLKLRLYLHYSKLNPAFAVAQLSALISSGGPFFTSNADNLQAPFYNLPSQRNPISQFEVSRPNYLFADQQILNMMNSKTDPRRPFYFTDFPWGSGNYVGVSAAAPPPIPNNNYSRIHTFLRGAVTAGSVPPFTYSGAAPQRMVTYAEYCFIRAEAGLMGVAGSDPQTWFTNGITASMQEVGVSVANMNAYLAANGTLTGTNAQKLKQIIEEKFVALFGVTVEPWTDWRRTGYPVLTVPTNHFTPVTLVPRSLFYPQSEIDLNPNCPGQKPDNLQSRVFWDNP